MIGKTRGLDWEKGEELDFSIESTFNDTTHYRGYIDCFEGEFAVVEFDNGMKDILNANVGECLIFDGHKITVSKEKPINWRGNKPFVSKAPLYNTNLSKDRNKNGIPHVNYYIFSPSH